MEVNFDVLRMKGAHYFNFLVKELNRHVDGEYIRDKGLDYGDIFTTGDLRDYVDGLRNVLATLLCIEDEQAKIKSLDISLEVFAPDACPQLCEVTELIIDAVNIDGAHHKQWYLEQIAVKLGIELPEHEKGIIP